MNAKSPFEYQFHFFDCQLALSINSEGKSWLLANGTDKAYKVDFVRSCILATGNEGLFARWEIIFLSF